MRSWSVRSAGAALFALALFAVLLPDRRPARPWYERGWEYDTVMIAAERDWRAAASRRQTAERRWRRADAVARLSEVGAVRGLTIRTDPRLPSHVREELGRIAAVELTAAGVNATQHPILVLGAADTAGLESRYTKGTILPLRESDPCGVVVRIPVRESRSFSISPTDRLLGTCAFYAAYGTPGTGMSQWLRDTQMASAAYLTPPASIAGDTGRIEFNSFESSWGLKGCRAGVARVCDLLFTTKASDVAMFNRDATLDSVALEYPGVTFFSAGSATSERSVVSGGLLAGVAADLGARRFTQLWTSDRSPSEAFATIEGRPSSDWVYDRVASHVEPYSRGPGPGTPRLIVSLALAVLVVAASARFTRRVMT